MLAADGWSPDTPDHQSGFSVWYYTEFHARYISLGWTYETFEDARDAAIYCGDYPFYVVASTSYQHIDENQEKAYYFAPGCSKKAADSVAV